MPKRRKPVGRRLSRVPDMWRVMFAAAADRPIDFCSGCGYWRHVHGAHRADCTATVDGYRRVRDHDH